MSEPTHAHTNTHALEFSDYLAAIKRRRLLLSTIALPILAIALALAIGLPDIYVASGLVAFADAEVSGELPTDRTSVRREKAYMDEYVNSLSGAVLSGQNLASMVKAMPRLAPGGDTGAGIKEIVRNTDVETVRVPVLDPDSGRDREVISAFTVSYGSRNPEIARQAAAWLTNSFMAVSRSNLQVRAKAAAQFYNTETENYRKQIAGLEAKLADFKAKNFGQLPELTDINMNVMDRTSRDLDDVSQQVRTLRQDRIFLNQQLEQARNAGTDEGLLRQLTDQYQKKLATYDENHPDMIALRRQIEALKTGGAAVDSMSLPAQLAAQKTVLAQARQRYSEDHPDVKRLEREIKTLETRIAAGETNAGNAAGTPAVVNLRTQINALDTQIAGLERRETDLRSKLDQFEKRVEATPQVEREYKTLTRDLDLARNKYEELQKSQMDSELTASAISAGKSDELRLVQAPFTPDKPAKPKRTAIAAIGLMLALLFGLTAVVLAESMDQSVRGSRDIRRVLAIAPLGVIPQIRDAAAVRRGRWRFAMLACSVMLGSAVLVMTVRSFY
jgi:uncharacterized protein involved in exopolysaccharide biosynthesis